MQDRVIRTNRERSAGIDKEHGIQGLRGAAELLCPGHTTIDRAEDAAHFTDGDGDIGVETVNPVKMMPDSGCM